MKICSHRRVGSLVFGLFVLIALLQNGCDWISGRSFGDFEGTVRTSDDKTITSAVGRGTKTYQGTPSQMATQFLNDNANRFGLIAGLGDLSLVSEKARPLGANVEFQQTRNGLPVENARIKVNFDKNGRVVQVVNSYTRPAGALDQTSVDKQRAAEIVINEFLRTTPHNPSKDEQQQPKQQQVPGKTVNRADLQLNEGEPRVDEVYFSRNGRLHRSYRISISAGRPFGSKQFVIDANSGEIVQTKDFVYNSDGEGQVFLPNPVNSLNDPSLFGLGPLSTVSTNNPNPYFTVALPELEASTGPFTLRGPFVVLEQIESPPSPSASPPAANGFTFFHERPEFEEVMIYYHIDRMQRYIQHELYFTDVMNRPLRADAHGYSGGENSHYVSTPTTLGQGYVAFGDGGVNDAEDADVIAHEYGHAIQDNQAPGVYSQNGQSRAMGEGFSDYWAFSSYAKESEAHGHNPAFLMEWDVAPKEFRRRVDDGPFADRFNFDFTDWENGRIWSTTLYLIFRSPYLDRKIADSLILQSHFNITSSAPSFRDGADAIMAADEQFSAAGIFPSKRATLCKIFKDRKIYTASDCTP